MRSSVNIEELVNKAAGAAADAAIKKYKESEREEKRRSKLRNTGILIDHYLDFVNHYESIKYRATDIIEDLEPMEAAAVTQEDITITAIKRSKIKTQIMIQSIKIAVNILENKMKCKGETEKYELFNKLYMDADRVHIKFNQRIKIVADEMNCSESTARRWANEMLGELSIHLWGVDGLRIEL